MSQIHIDLRTLHAALGGVISGGQVLCAGPNHSKKDRSLAVKPTANGIVTYSFAGDDWLDCRDYVHDRLGLPRWQPGQRQDTAIKRTAPENNEPN
jgi:putative DNA primase/helicase